MSPSDEAYQRLLEFIKEHTNPDTTAGRMERVELIKCLDCLGDETHAECLADEEEEDQ